MIIEITDPLDPRIDAYRDLRRQEPSDGFIAEGASVVRRLLQSKLGVRSLILLKGQERKYIDLIPDSVPAYVVDRQLGMQIAGYDFHRGVLAHGEVPAMWNYRALLTRRPQVALGMIGVSDPENVGSLLRSAAALGVQDILVDPTTIPPFVRRVVRVSMASVFQHRLYRLDRPLEQIVNLQEGGICCAATTLAPDAVTIDGLRERLCGAPVVLLVGNEAEGLAADIQTRCRVRTTLPMAADIDSLNVGVAGAIFLHELTRGAR